LLLISFLAGNNHGTHTEKDGKIRKRLTTECTERKTTEHRKIRKKTYHGSLADKMTQASRRRRTELRRSKFNDARPSQFKLLPAKSNHLRRHFRQATLLGYG
jgi:hypothetical protein